MGQWQAGRRRPTDRRRSGSVLFDQRPNGDPDDEHQSRWFAVRQMVAPHGSRLQGHRDVEEGRQRVTVAIATTAMRARTLRQGAGDRAEQMKGNSRARQPDRAGRNRGCGRRHDPGRRANLPPCRIRYAGNGPRRQDQSADVAAQGWMTTRDDAAQQAPTPLGRLVSIVVEGHERGALLRRDLVEAR
jgi:hypothetical protein